MERERGIPVDDRQGAVFREVEQSGRHQRLHDGGACARFFFVFYYKKSTTTGADVNPSNLTFFPPMYQRGSVYRCTPYYVFLQAAGRPFLVAVY